MKTTNTKNALRNFKADYLTMMAEVERRRKVYRAMREEFKAEEERILEDLFATVEKLTDKLGRFPSAAEITAAMGGAMSQPEVVGHLTVALCEHYNGASYPQPTKNSRSKAVQARKGKMTSTYTETTRRFVEIDDRGEVLPDGKAIHITKTVKTYGLR